MAACTKGRSPIRPSVVARAHTLTHEAPIFEGNNIPRKLFTLKFTGHRSALGEVEQGGREVGGRDGLVLPASHMEVTVRLIFCRGRRALDMEGWSNDVGLLRKQLAAAERKMKEMKLIERLPGASQHPYLCHFHYQLLNLIRYLCGL